MNLRDSTVSKPSLTGVILLGSALPSSKMQTLEKEGITSLTWSFLRSFSAVSDRPWECQHTGWSEKRDSRMERKQEVARG